MSPFLSRCPGLPIQPLDADDSLARVVLEVEQRGPGLGQWLPGSERWLLAWPGLIADHGQAISGVVGEGRHLGPRPRIGTHRGELRMDAIAGDTRKALPKQAPSRRSERPTPPRWTRRRLWRGYARFRPLRAH